MLKEIDHKLRLIFSYIFRIIIVAYSLVLFLNDKNNYFPTYVYLIICILYIIIHVTLKKTFKNNYSLIRLIVDYAFIYAILFGRDINEFLNYFLLILPIINSPNNSTNHITSSYVCKSYYVYPFCAFGLLLLSNFAPQIILFAPLITITFIDQFLKLRSSIENIHSAIFRIIDEFYTKNYGQKELSKIYSDLILEINSTSYIKNHYCPIKV
jgi:hypothetical protein